MGVAQLAFRPHTEFRPLIARIPNSAHCKLSKRGMATSEVFEGVHYYIVEKNVQNPVKVRYITVQFWLPFDWLNFTGEAIHERGWGL